jgi:hypothetical protein
LRRDERRFGKVVALEIATAPPLAVGLASMAPYAQRLEVLHVVAAAFALGFDMIDLCLSLACTDATTGSTSVCVTHEHDLA